MSKKNIYFYIILTIISLIVYKLNLLYPLFADDWNYTFIFGSDHSRVTNITDIFVSQYNHYFSWGGRTIAHIIAQLLLLMGSQWADLLNSLAFILFLLTIYKVSNIGLPKFNIKLLIFLWLIIYILIPPLVSCVLWITVSANYLWCTLIILIFTYQYYKYYYNKKSSDGVIKNLFFLLFGIIAGWTNENMVIAEIFFIIMLFYIIKKKKEKIPYWFILGFIGLLIGGSLLLLAPGNFVRAEQLEKLYKYPSFYERIIAQLYVAQKRFINQILPLSIIYLLLLVYSKKYQKKTPINSEILNGSLLFFISGQIAWIVMIASPDFPSRATFGSASLIITAIGILYSNINLKLISKKINTFILLMLFAFFIVQFYSDYKYLSFLSINLMKQEKFIESEKIKGNKNIILHKGADVPKRYIPEDLTDDPNYWLNKSYSRYYDLNSIKLIKK